MTQWRQVRSLARPTDSCDGCGWASWETPSRIGHWLCTNPQVRAAIGRERIAVGVAFEACAGRWHTRAEGRAA